MVSAARRILSEKSKSAFLSCNFSEYVKSLFLPFPSTPSNLWYIHELDLPKYFIDIFAHDISIMMSESPCFTVSRFDITVVSILLYLFIIIIIQHVFKQLTREPFKFKRWIVHWSFVISNGFYQVPFFVGYILFSKLSVFHFLLSVRFCKNSTIFHIMHNPLMKFVYVL